MNRKSDPSIVVVDVVDELTPEWLTAALRTIGHDVAVTRLSCAPIGAGQMGATYRLDYDVTGDDASLPASLVVKLAAHDRAARSLVAPGYRAEVTFYRDVADTVAVRAPRCHLALITDDDEAFTLLLEDLSSGTPGDQIAGADPAAVVLAATNLAGLHGPRWDDPSLLAESWTSQTDKAGAEFVGELVMGAIPQLLDRIGDRLADGDAHTLESAAAVLPTFLLDHERHLAPLHGDYRLDNLMFSADGATVSAVDWQTLTLGLPARDLAYLIGTSLSIEDRRVAEDNIVEAYRGALATHGVTGYSAAEAFDDFRVGLMQCPLIIVLGSAFGSRTERGDAMFAAMARRSCAAMRDLRTIDALS
jgi:aminoglycoside/choline kinase family phosphotransferase